MRVIMRVDLMRVNDIMRVMAPKRTTTYGEHECEFCGEVFMRRSRWGRFCRDKCRYDWHNREKPNRNRPKAQAEAHDHS